MLWQIVVKGHVSFSLPWSASGVPMSALCTVSHENLHSTCTSLLTGLKFFCQQPSKVERGQDPQEGNIVQVSRPTAESLPLAGR